MLVFAVAPYAGAWIEIDTADRKTEKLAVAPYAGAWIEITRVGHKPILGGRTLRGCVD